MSYSLALCLCTFCERKYWNLYRNPLSSRRQPHKTLHGLTGDSFRQDRYVRSHSIIILLSCVVRKPDRTYNALTLFSSSGHELSVIVYVSVVSTEIPVTPHARRFARARGRHTHGVLIHENIVTTYWVWRTLPRFLLQKPNDTRVDL